MTTFYTVCSCNLESHAPLHGWSQLFRTLEEAKAAVLADVNALRESSGYELLTAEQLVWLREEADGDVTHEVCGDSDYDGFWLWQVVEHPLS